MNPTLQQFASSFFLFLFSLYLFRPFNNPSETYRYYSLPFCHVHDDDDIEKLEKGDSTTAIQRSLQRQRLVNGQYNSADKYGHWTLVEDTRKITPYHITFLDPKPFTSLCTKTYNVTEINKWKEVILNRYFYEMSVEDIPMWVR